MWDSHLAQNQQKRRKRRGQTQVQKGGIVYAADVPRHISMMEEAMARSESNLDADQKLCLLILRTSILPQLLLRTKKKKEVADRTATNTIRRAVRASKKRKRDEIEQDIRESTADLLE